MVQLRIKDDIRENGFTHTFHQNITVDPSSIIVLRFDDQGISTDTPGRETL